jgi:hypothetical protein
MLAVEYPRMLQIMSCCEYLTKRPSSRWSIEIFFGKFSVVEFGVQVFAPRHFAIYQRADGV